MSTYPITKSLFLPFKQYNPLTLDRFAEKGFLTAWITIGDKEIQVINTHLQSADYDKYDPYAFVQIEELFDYVRYIGIESGGTIVGGDFNIDISHMKKRYMPSEKDLCVYHPSDPTIYIDFSTGHSQSNKALGYDGLTFDYFFTTKDISLSPVTIESDYSDHNPVESVITFL
jgi:endonuclease/exonuclease/phosphatase family metal-dependent hydrolase